MESICVKLASVDSRKAVKQLTFAENPAGNSNI